MQNVSLAKLTGIFALMLLATSWITSPSTGQPAAARPAVVWEYKVSEPGVWSEQVMNALGREGWELVAAPAYYHPDVAASRTLIFKRPK